MPLHWLSSRLQNYSNWIVFFSTVISCLNTSTSLSQKTFLQLLFAASVYRKSHPPSVILLLLHWRFFLFLACLSFGMRRIWLLFWKVNIINVQLCVILLSFFSFHRYGLSTYHRPGPVLGIRDQTMDKTKPLLIHVVF